MPGPDSPATGNSVSGFLDPCCHRAATLSRFEVSRSRIRVGPTRSDTGGEQGVQRHGPARAGVRREEGSHVTQTETSLTESIDELRHSLEGDVVVPGEVQYDAARVCFNAFVDRRPAVIVRCLGRADVATAFGFARANELEVAVRGGGHNPAGHCVLDGGLVIDLSRMRRVHVDRDAQIARAEGGSTWLDFDTATVAEGLLTPGGVVGSTGVAGLALGGGIGHLTSQHGLTCDNIVGAELVTPDGSVVRASADENPELLWGLRGGGGNFGVATHLAFRLHPARR